MEKEEKILKDYIEGKAIGEDNKLKAAIGNLSAHRTKELTEAIRYLLSEFGRASSNLMINLGYQTGIINQGIENQVTALNRGIETQVSNLIFSNEELAKSNEKYAQKTQKFTLVNILLTIIITLTGLVGLWNLILTNEIKNESVRTNQINEQPLLIFNDYNNRPYKFINSGKGVAINFMMVMWDKNAKQLYMTPERGVGDALGVDMSTSVKPSDLIKTNFSEAEKIPDVAKLIKAAQVKDTSWLALLYQDIYGNPFATLVLGPGGEYNESVRFIRLNKVNER